MKKASGGSIKDSDLGVEVADVLRSAPTQPGGPKYKVTLKGILQETAVVVNINPHR